MNLIIKMKYSPNKEGIYVGLNNHVLMILFTKRIYYETY